MIEKLSLAKLLEKDKKKFSLEEAAEMMRIILYALDHLHRKGRLHLALCPENILLFPDHVLLIHQRDEGKKNRMVLAYTAPEVRLKNLSEIGPKADIYSACAIFFHLIMRRRMAEEEIIGMGFYQRFSPNSEVFSKISEEQMQKTLHILFKGLHTLPRKRYSCVEELLREVEELCEISKRKLLYQEQNKI